jgi:dTDP-4-dehydrorhamnose 3,5-epimerase
VADSAGDANIVTTFHPLAIAEVILVKPEAHADPRGFFLETHKDSVYRKGGLPQAFVQDNCSRSTRGTLRGLHFQAPPHSQGKLISVVRGEILDIAVDIRRGSPTFGSWVAANLSDENHHQLYLPVGFAHGFLVLSKEADITYKVTVEYNRKSELGIIWNDPDLCIDWGIVSPVLSERDQELPRLADIEIPFKCGATENLLGGI